MPIVIKNLFSSMFHSLLMLIGSFIFVSARQWDWTKYVTFLLNKVENIGARFYLSPIIIFIYIFHQTQIPQGLSDLYEVAESWILHLCVCLS